MHRGMRRRRSRSSPTLLRADVPNQRNHTRACCTERAFYRPAPGALGACAACGGSREGRTRGDDHTDGQCRGGVCKARDERGAHSCHICTRAGLTFATSAPRLGSPMSHLHRDWAHPCHIWAGAPRLPHLHPNATRPSLPLRWVGACPCQFCGPQGAAGCQWSISPRRFVALLPWHPPASTRSRASEGSPSAALRCAAAGRAERPRSYRHGGAQPRSCRSGPSTAPPCAHTCCGAMRTSSETLVST
jgi:hypothetical protein